jgi:hypothetical protein
MGSCRGVRAFDLPMPKSQQSWVLGSIPASFDTVESEGAADEAVLK